MCRISCGVYAKVEPRWGLTLTSQVKCGPLTTRSAGSEKTPHPSASAHRRDATTRVWKMPLIPAGRNGHEEADGVCPSAKGVGDTRFINSSVNHPGCWSKHSGLLVGVQRCKYTFLLSLSDLNKKAFCFLSPPTPHGWPHLKKRVRVEKKRGPSVVQTQTSGFYGSLTVLSWLQECVDCVTEVVVGWGWGD